MPLWCAAGISTCLILLVLLGSLASAAPGGRRVGLIISGVQLAWAVTTSTLVLRVSARPLARITATTVSPSAALVLY